MRRTSTAVLYCIETLDVNDAVLVYGSLYCTVLLQYDIVLELPNCQVILSCEVCTQKTT